MPRAAALALLLALLATQATAQHVLLYSRADEAQAQHIERLLRMTVATWRDRDLVPGQLWRPAIAERICSADRVLVLWSARSAASPHVAAEIATAASCGRVLVPVLLDQTPLAAELAPWQAIDLR